MKNLRMLLLSGMLLAPAGAQAQTIRGVVLEDGTRRPIAAARVDLMGARSIAAAQTDSLGGFVVRLRHPGDFIVRVTHLSYAALESDTVSLGAGETITIELRMGRSAIPLEPLVVTARSQARLGGFYDRLRGPGFGRFLTRADIDSRPTTRTTDLLQGMPGIEIMPVRRGRGASAVHLITMRGGMGRCQPAIFIDGMHVRQFPESGVDDFLKPEMLEGVEIYSRSAGAPVEFLTAENACGVVGFWTRSNLGSKAGKFSWKKLFAVTGVALLMTVPALITH